MLLDTVVGRNAPLHVYQTVSVPDPASVTYAIQGTSWFNEFVLSPLDEHRAHGLGYQAVIALDAKEGGYIATIPALPGVVTEGEDYSQVIGFLEDALNGWLRVAKARGLEIPAPKINPNDQTSVNPPKEAQSRARESRLD